MTLVVLAVVVGEIKDGVVGHQIRIVEEETVKTQTCGKLEIRGDAPVILGINSKLVEPDACGRVLLPVVAVGEADNFRGCAVDEVIHAGIAVVTGTVAHVGVVGHLILIAYTAHDLVVAGIVCEVVLDVEDVVVNGVIPCEELVSERHVLDIVA